MTNMVQIQRKYFSLRPQPFLLLSCMVSLTELVLLSESRVRPIKRGRSSWEVYPLRLVQVGVPYKWITALVSLTLRLELEDVLAQGGYLAITQGSYLAITKGGYLVITQGSYLAITQGSFGLPL